MTKQTLRQLSFLLVCLLLLSLCLPALAANHTCDHECCAICYAFEVVLRLCCALLLAAAPAVVGCAAVRAFILTLAERRLFATPVVLKVKLSD